MNFTAEYADKTVLVTGAAGFVGSHLVDRLVELGTRVRALDDLSDGDLDNLRLSENRIDFIHRSVADPGGLDDVVGGCDFVFHLGANASVPRSVERPDVDFESNVVGTHRILESIRRTGAGPLIFTSSAAVYGEPRTPAMDEDHPRTPISPYAGTKLAGEHLVASYCRCFGLDRRTVRIFNTFGPRQRKYVMFDLLEKLRKNSSRLEILGSGDQVRTYNYVADTVTAFLLVGVHPDARDNVYNIGGTRTISIREVAALIIELLGIDPPEIIYTGESWKGDIQRLCGDIGRLQGIGYEIEVGLEKGLRRLIDWHAEEYSPPWARARSSTRSGGGSTCGSP